MNTKANLDFMHRFCEAAIKYIALVPLVLLMFLTAMFQTTIIFHWYETCTITWNGPKFFALLPVGILLLGAVCKALHYIPEKLLLAVCTVVYLVAGLFVIGSMNYEFRGDVLLCFTNAWNFHLGDYSNIYIGSYLYRVPHQLGLMVYESLLLNICEDPRFLCVVNLLWVILTNLFIWLSARLVYEKAPHIRKIIVLVCFAFLPNFFYLFFVYGTVPGFACLVIALYFVIRTIKKNCVWSLVLSLVFMAMACMVKKNFLIGGIALILVYLMTFLKKKQLIYIVGIVGLAGMLIIPNKLLISRYENLTGSSLTNGMPSTLYIAMGLQENVNDWCAFGWYNHYNDTVYNDTEYNPELSSQIAIASIQDRIQTFVSDPGYALDFFGEKIITTWCEPTFQSVWSGPTTATENNSTDVAFLDNLYSGGSVFMLLASVMNVLVVAIFLFSVVYVAWKIFRNRESMNPLELFGLIYFMGGFLFHFVWETKSQYVYPYVMVLIPLAANGLWLVITKLTTIISRRNHLDLKEKE